jgi:hypothetical protein
MVNERDGDPQHGVAEKRSAFVYRGQQSPAQNLGIESMILLRK